MLGGRLCLDFVNTVDVRKGELVEDDLLEDYPDLVYWSHVVGLLREDEVNALLERAQSFPAEAARTFEQAMRLRETIHRVFAALAHRILPLQTDLGELRDAYVQALTHGTLLPADAGFVWHWARESSLESVLWPVIFSALALVTSAESKRVKECPGAGDCGWLFLDTSKNGSRVWCSMEGCGSRVKMRRQYARKRNAEV